MLDGIRRVAPARHIHLIEVVDSVDGAPAIRTAIGPDIGCVLLTDDTEMPDHLFGAAGRAADLPDQGLVVDRKIGRVCS